MHHAVRAVLPARSETVRAVLPATGINLRELGGAHSGSPEGAPQSYRLGLNGDLVGALGGREAHLASPPGMACRFLASHFPPQPAASMVHLHEEAAAVQASLQQHGRSNAALAVHMMADEKR